MAKKLELQLQHQSFQWIVSVDFLYWLVWSPCSPRDSQESSPAPQFKSIKFFSTQPSLWSTSPFPLRQHIKRKGDQAANRPRVGCWTVEKITSKVFQTDCGSWRFHIQVSFYSRCNPLWSTRGGENWVATEECVQGYRNAIWSIYDFNPDDTDSKACYFPQIQQGKEYEIPCRWLIFPFGIFISWKQKQKLQISSWLSKGLGVYLLKSMLFII